MNACEHRMFQSQFNFTLGSITQPHIKTQTPPTHHHTLSTLEKLLTTSYDVIHTSLLNMQGQRVNSTRYLRGRLDQLDSSPAVGTTSTCVISRNNLTCYCLNASVPIYLMLTIFPYISSGIIFSPLHELMLMFPTYKPKFSLVHTRLIHSIPA